MRKTKFILAFCLVICVMAMVTACSHSHQPSSEWSSDADGHWHSCADVSCAEKLDFSAHVFGEGVETTPATEEAEGVMTYECKACGYEKTEAIEKLAHTHSYAKEWSNDETHHWHESTCGHEAADKSAHMFDDGWVETSATETQDGLMIYTCVDCGYEFEEIIAALSHTHTYSDDWTTDEEFHWHAATCGHNLVKGHATHDFGKAEITKEPTEEEEGITSYFCKTCGYEKQEIMDKLEHVHVFGDDNLCRCGYEHKFCEICEKCLSIECTECRTQCSFIEPDRTIHFVPSASLAAPEGPDGREPGKEGAYLYDQSIKVSHIVTADGTKAMQVSLPDGTPGHSGVSFANNKNMHAYGAQGFNCGQPVVSGEYAYLRLYFTNTGNSEVTFKYSAINYYFDYGFVTLTLQPGESAVALMRTMLGGASSGVNHQIVFTEKAEAGASLVFWGEYAADKNLSGVSVATSASKLQFCVGETFSATGLILKASGTNYGNVYIVDNYTTDLDGYVFTEEDLAAGKKTVTVNFAGFTTTYEITVCDHIHNMEYVPKVDPVKCESDGAQAYYRCTVEGCGLLSTDDSGKNVISEPEAISCHTPEGITLPGEAIRCADCSKEVGKMSMNNWVHYMPPAQVNNKIGAIGNVTLGYGDVNGTLGTHVTFAKGTVGAANNTIGFKFHCENNLDSDNGNPYQHKLPNVGTNMADGSTRELIMYFVNYGSEDVTVTFKNDNYGNTCYITVTIPAGGSAIGKTTMKKQAGYNFFELYLNNTEALKNDVKIGMFGYFNLLNGEIDAPTVKKEATKTTFKVGEGFSAEGLVLNAFLPNTYGRDVFVNTGYTTSLDGYTFTAEDVGTKTVTVYLAGKTCTYEITVEN